MPVLYRLVSKRSTFLAVLALLLISGVLSYFAALGESPTFDEPLHATAGYLIRWGNDYRLDVEDPALFPLLATVPQSRSDLHIDPGDPRLDLLLHDHDQQWAIVTRAMFRTPRPDGRSLYSGVDYIQRARIVFVGIDLILGGMIAWWTYQIARNHRGTAQHHSRIGPHDEGATSSGMSVPPAKAGIAALIAAGIFAFDPNFMGHGPLVKNDVSMALLMLWLMFAVWRFGQRATPPRLLSIALSCAAAMNIKFSGVIFVPLMMLALLIRAIMPGAWPMCRRELSSRGARIGFTIATSILVGLFCWGSIWLVYRCRFSLAADPSVRFDRGPFVHDLKHRVWVSAFPGKSISTEQIDAIPLPPAARATLWGIDHHLLPQAWLYGFLFAWETSLLRATFLLGHTSTTGWWYYFPLAMLFKTPLALLIAAAAIIGRFILRWCWKRPSWDAICLWLPIVVYGAICIRTHLNIGIRHIFPIYPFIFVLIAAAIAKLPRGFVIGMTLVILIAIESLACWPHEIAFFNVASGGTRGGMRLLSDSNLDWGQDLPLLADWQQQHSGTRLYLSYFGSTDPHVYGIDYVNIAEGYPFSDLPVEPMNLPGVFAISATFLQGTYAGPELTKLASYLKDRQPLAVLGGTIFVYDWNPADYAACLDKRRKP